MHKAPIAVFASTFTFASALADSGATPPTLPPTAEQAPNKSSAPPTGSSKRREANDAKRRAIEKAMRSGPSKPLGHRGPPKTDKKWDEMTPVEQDEARRRWLLNSVSAPVPMSGQPK